MNNADKLPKKNLLSLQIDLSKFDVKEAAGLLGKLKGILGK